MRIVQLVIISCFTAALGVASGCGGNVVVDSGSGGTGGAGTSNNAGTTSAGQTGTSVVASAGASMTTSGGPGPTATSVGSGTGTCGDQSCYVGSDGSCGCEVICSGQSFRSRCLPSPTGSFCECSINDMNVGKCEGAVAVCDVFLSCCGQFFKPGG